MELSPEPGRYQPFRHSESIPTLRPWLRLDTDKGVLDPPLAEVGVETRSEVVNLFSVDDITESHY